MQKLNLGVNIGDTNISDLKDCAAKAVAEISERAGKAGQFLNWIDVLPKNQIATLDNLYDLAAQAKADGATDLAILGIGGSRHTTESMVNLLGLEDNIHFYSSVDPISFKKFAKTLNLDTTKFLVVSKSGGTLETTVAYENAKKLLQEHFGKEDVSDKFIAMTDASSEKSNLRRIVDKGEIKISGFVHDDVGGRFSILDDATIFTLAFAGMEKAEVKKMLEASLSAQKEFLNPNIEENAALQLAAFNVKARENGKIKHFVEYFGDVFSGAVLWEKQMKNESLKAMISTDTNIGPGYLHYNAEADLDVNNKDSFYTFVSVKTNDKVANAVLTGVIAAYGAQHPVSIIELASLNPADVARFIELKHFETIYTGNLLRRLKDDVTTMDVAMPEVLQPNVEIYKKEVKKALG